MDKHPLPKEGIQGTTCIEEILDKMIKDQSIPLNDTGEVKMAPGEQKNKRFKFHNDTGSELDLEVFSNMPNYIDISTPTLTVPFNQKKQTGFGFIKFVINAPLTPSQSDILIMIFKRADGKLVPLELFKFKLQTWE